MDRRQDRGADQAAGNTTGRTRVKEKGEPEPMGQQEEQNKALARRMIDALSNADVEFVKENYAEDFRIWVSGSLPFSGAADKASAVAGMPAVLGLFPEGLRFEIVGMTAEGDRVAIEARSEGRTARGDLYRQEYHFLMRVRDGRIIEWKEYMDTEHARKVLVGE
ncbi:MAG TPA: nuclear transport factor 2 family protein [Deltaproteobacteria bacterium]|nr:nuclear transport factor 2 family protein [Deltaproteobacteria bacterium]